MIKYTVQVLPKEATIEQQIKFSELLKNLGRASASEIQEVLAEREVVEPEEGLDQETVRGLQTKLSVK